MWGGVFACTLLKSWRQVFLDVIGLIDRAFDFLYTWQNACSRAQQMKVNFDCRQHLELFVPGVPRHLHATGVVRYAFVSTNCTMVLPQRQIGCLLWFPRFAADCSDAFHAHFRYVSVESALSQVN